MIRNAEVVQRVKYRTPSLTLIVNQGGVVVHILVLICNNVRLHDKYNIKLQVGTPMSRNECTKAKNKSCNLKQVHILVRSIFTYKETILKN
jgi:hypothetical protein